MTSISQKLNEFHEAFEMPHHDVMDEKEMKNFDSISLRVKLIDEEYNEYNSAKNMTEKLDALGDLLYVIYGAGSCFGINIDKLIQDEYLNKNIASSSHATTYQIVYSKVHSDFDLEMYSMKFIDGWIQGLSYCLITCQYKDIPDLLKKMALAVFHRCCNLEIDVDELVDIIHKSNMTKLCHSKDEADKSVEFYKKTESKRYPLPTYKTNSNGTLWILYDATTGKRLKSINYQPPKIDVRGLTLR